MKQFKINVLGTYQVTEVTQIKYKPRKYKTLDFISICIEFS